MYQVIIRVYDYHLNGTNFSEIYKFIYFCFRLKIKVWTPYIEP